MNSNETLLLFLFFFSYAFSQATQPILNSTQRLAKKSDSVPKVTDTSSQVPLGEIYFSRYEFFLTQNRNPDSAYYYLLKAYRLGVPDAIYFVGLGYLRGVDGFPFRPKRGLELLHTLADTGHAFAALRLMEIYGDTSPSPFLHPFFIQIRNPKKAVQYAKIAAEKGKPEAHRFLAWAYHTGYGVKRNDTLAVHYLQQLAEKWNSSWAQTQLGMWYYYGFTSLGVRFDLAKHYFGMVLQNPYAQPEEVAEAESSLHEIERFPQLILNLIFRLLYFFPSGDLVQELRW
jgi:TPR repeat protein